MKARVKATGDIGIVSQIDVLLKDDFISFSPNNVELMTNYVDKTDDYWEELKHQYAGMAMQAYINNNVYMREIRTECKTPKEMRELIADLSILLATALVERLKNE